MANYKVYVMGQTGHVVDAIEIEATTDAEAVRVARQLKPGIALEVWEHARKVAAIPK